MQTRLVRFKTLDGHELTVPARNISHLYRSPKTDKKSAGPPGINVVIGYNDLTYEISEETYVALTMVLQNEYQNFTIVPDSFTPSK